MKVDGTSVLAKNTQGFYTVDASFDVGPHAVEVLYYNNANVGSFNLTVEGATLTAVAGAAAAPVPAALPLALIGLGALALVRRRAA